MPISPPNIKDKVFTLLVAEGLECALHHRDSNRGSTRREICHAPNPGWLGKRCLGDEAKAANKCRAAGDRPIHNYLLARDRRQATDNIAWDTRQRACCWPV